jgi:choline dehydrogenase-like flavoprotein
MPPGGALTSALRNTTLEVARGVPRCDAIVIGAGAAGGLAACLLTEAGLRVLVLDAGSASSRIRKFARRLSHGAARRLLGTSAPKVLDHILRSPLGSKLIARRQPIQSRCYAWALAPWAFVDDIDCPYVTPPNHPFVWLRARQLGGRMVVPGHGRQYYRLGPNEFSPFDGLSPPWPLQPGELDPWYAAVERRLALAGRRDNLPWLPDSELSIVLEPTPAEVALQASISARWPGARPIMGRFAPPLAALEAAAQTGRLLIRGGAIAREIEVDNSGCVRGVVWVDQQKRTEERVIAPLVFLCASALESTRLLLLSRSPRSPDGLGARSGVLGRCLMDHVRLKVEGSGPPLLSEPPPEEGRCLYLPRFDARNLSAPGPERGFGVQVLQLSASAGRSHFIAVSFAEMLPRLENRVMLDPKRRDVWGIPALYIDCSHGRRELCRAREQATALRQLAEVARVTLTQIDEAPAPPGSANHECGTARMGSDPTNSVLDPHNECWDARGLYVTDAACFPSQGTKNPTLTVLALTARACDHAVRTKRCR